MTQQSISSYVDSLDDIDQLKRLHQLAVARIDKLTQAQQIKILAVSTSDRRDSYFKVEDFDKAHARLLQLLNDKRYRESYRLNDWRIEDVYIWPHELDYYLEF